MSNVIKLADSRQHRSLIRDKAGEFLARLDAGATPEDLLRIEEWLAENPLHRDIFLEMAAQWDDMSMLKSLADIFPLEDYSPRRIAPRHARQWALAGSLVISVAALTWLAPGMLSNLDTAPVADAGFYQQHETLIGEQSTLTLPDASEIILNTNTRIEVAYSGSARNIFLRQGEAFFNVTQDPDRPFRVYAGKRMVEAVGTSFTVQHTQPDNVEVVVKEGRVNFLRLVDIMDASTLPDNIDSILYRDENVSLVAGELAEAITDQTNAVEKKMIQALEIEAKLAWTQGMLLFQSESLENVLQEMGRYTTTRIEADDSILNIEVDGYYIAGDIDGLLVAMKLNFGIDSMKVGDNLVLLFAEP